MKYFRLLCCLVFATTSLSLFAQQDPPPPASQSQDTTILSPFTVSEKPISTFAAIYSDRPYVKSVPRDVIEVGNQTNLPALLKTIGIADIRQRGMHDVQADVSIRGGSFEQTLILVNGLPFNDPQTGHHSMNLPVSLYDIERIDVMSSTEGEHLYGGYAMGGVINIITRNNSSLARDGALHVVGGSHRFGRVYGAVRFPTGRWGHFLSVDESFTDGHTHNTDFRRRQVWLNTHTQWGRIHFDMDGGWMNKAFGANSFYSPRFPDQAEEISSSHLSARLSRQGKLNWVLRGNARLHHDRFELFRNEAPEWYGGHNHHKTNVYTGGGELLCPTGFGDLRATATLRHEQILSNVLGHPTDSLKVPGEDAWYRYADQRQWGEMALSFRSRFHKGVNAEASLIIAMLPNGALMPLPRITISPVMPGSSLMLKGGLSRNYRLPTFTEMFYQGPTNTGNPNLTHEEAVTVDVNALYLYHALQVNATLFFRDNRNLIDWVRTADETIWRSENLTRIHTYGSSVVVSLKPRKAWNSVAYADASWTFTDQAKRNPDSLISYYVLDHLRNKFTFTAHHQLVNKRLVFVWDIVWQQREGSYTTADGDQAHYPDALLVDAGVRFQAASFLQIKADVHNVMNTMHYDFSGVVHPGRWFSAGVTINKPW